MINRHFDFSMATIAKRHKVIKFVSNINNKIVPSRIKMMNMQTSTFRTGRSAAPSASLVSLYGFGANLFPSAPVGQPSPTLVVGVIGANSPILGTLVRTKASPSFNFAGKSAEVIPALLARQQLCGDKSFVPALNRAVVNIFALWIEFFLANCAIGNKPILYSPILVALRTAKVGLSFFRITVSFLVRLSAIVASHLDAAFCMFVGAFQTTQKDLAVVGLKFLLAMETNLEHY